MHAFLTSLVDLDWPTLLTIFGYAGIFALVFTESAFFFGFFLPGDTLLFTAGLLASKEVFNLIPLIVIIALAAILGGCVGYWIGATIGVKMFDREDSRFFKKKHIQTAHNFFTKYGAYTVILARFVPVIRAFVPTIAGIGDMGFNTFLSYNIIGGILWAIVVPLIGFFLGNRVPNIAHYLPLVISCVVILSFIPILAGLVSNKKTK